MERFLAGRQFVGAKLAHSNKRLCLKSSSVWKKTCAPASANNRHPNGTKQLDCPPILVGGVEDHIHLLA
jgi:hypothetical protein